MEALKNPQGDVYDIRINTEGSIVIPFGTEFFSVKARVKNCDTATWDTSDHLRLAVWLVEPAPKDLSVPHHLVEGRLSFPRQFISPAEEIDFDVNLNINLVPKGSYLLVFDLVIEWKYFLSSTGGKRQSFQIEIIDRDALGVRFHPNLRLPAGPACRTRLADLSAGSPTSAFQLIGAETLLQRTDEGNLTGQSWSNYQLSYKKIVVKFDWWPLFFRHYAHFLEFILCLHAICQEYAGDVDELIVLIGDQEFTNGNNPDVQRFFFDALFKNWTVLPRLDDAAIEDATFVIDFNGRRQKTPMNRIVVDHLGLISNSIELFKARCIGSFTALPRRPDRKRAVYAKRGGSRSFSEKAELQLLSIFTEFGFEVVHLDFGKLTIHEQISAAFGASVMFGVHGNNLTNCFWLPQGAALVEIFPSGFHGNDFQVLCEISGSTYLGVEARELGFVHRELTRLPDWTLLGEPYSTPKHHQDDIDFIPVNIIKAFLRNIA